MARSRAHGSPLSDSSSQFGADGSSGTGARGVFRADGSCGVSAEVGLRAQRSRKPSAQAMLGAHRSSQTTTHVEFGARDSPMPDARTSTGPCPTLRARIQARCSGVGRSARASPYRRGWHPNLFRLRADSPAKPRTPVSAEDRSEGDSGDCSARRRSRTTPRTGSTQAPHPYPFFFSSSSVASIWSVINRSFARPSFRLTTNRRSKESTRTLNPPRSTG